MSRLAGYGGKQKPPRRAIRGGFNLFARISRSDGDYRKLAFTAPQVVFSVAVGSPEQVTR